MGFQGHRFCLSMWLLLVVLTCLSQGHLSSQESLTFNSVTDMFESIHKNIHKRWHGMHSVFGKRVPRSSTTSTSTTSTTISPSNSASINMDEWVWDISDLPTTTTTEEPSEGVLFRQIITFPHRCPDNHDFVRGKCRKRVT